MHRKSKSILIDLKTTDILSHSLFNSLLYPHASRIYRWTKNIEFIPWKHWLKHIKISYKGHVLKSNISGFSILMSLELYLHIIVLGYDKTNSKMNICALSDFINKPIIWYTPNYFSWFHYEKLDRKFVFSYECQQIPLAYCCLW